MFVMASPDRADLSGLTEAFAASMLQSEYRLSPQCVSRHRSQRPSSGPDPQADDAESAADGSGSLTGLKTHDDLGRGGEFGYNAARFVYCSGNFAGVAASEI